MTMDQFFSIFASLFDKFAEFLRFPVFGLSIWIYLLSIMILSLIVHLLVGRS